MKSMPSKYLISAFVRRWAVEKAKEMSLPDNRWKFVPQMDKVQRAYVIKTSRVDSKDYLIGKFSDREIERVVQEVR